MKVWTPVEVLITARTYPTPATKGIEVSCTGGVTRDGRWIRLYPVPYRFLDEDKRFRKYQWIEANAAKSSDSRPESFHLDPDSIRILTEPLTTATYWKARKEIIAPLASRSLCWLQAERDIHQAPTLGFFKPKEIRRLVIEPDEPWTPAELAKLRRNPLFGTAPKEQLEQIPYKFKYQFTCDDPSCTGHMLSCVDWEMGQSYRRWFRTYADWEIKFRQKYETEMIQKLDTHFFVGTVRSHPGSWIIIGLFYPPKEPLGIKQMSLW